MMNSLRRGCIAMLIGGLVLLWASAGNADEANFRIALDDGADINVEVLPAPGSLLVIWFVDHSEIRPQFEAMLKAIGASGIELWRVDMLADYFLPRSAENIRTLPGAAVAAVIDAAHQRSDKLILVATYDRMVLPLLRGVREWSTALQGHSRFAGSILYYPNPFDALPAAGIAPQLDPVVAASNYPLVIVQPARGSQRWRINEVMQALWDAGAPAYLRILPEVRDWFFMHPPGDDPRETRTTAEVPGDIHKYAALLRAAPKPTAAIKMERNLVPQASVHDLVPLASRSFAPTLKLREMNGELHSADFPGNVTLVNFWATWCPPCVEELPSLNRLQQRYSGRPFRLISVDFRESGRSWNDSPEKYRSSSRFCSIRMARVHSPGRCSVFPAPSWLTVKDASAIRSTVQSTGRHPKSTH